MNQTDTAKAQLVQVLAARAERRRMNQEVIDLWTQYAEARAAKRRGATDEGDTTTDSFSQREARIDGFAHTMVERFAAADGVTYAEFCERYGGAR